MPSLKKLEKDLAEIKAGLGNPHISEDIKAGMKETAKTLQDRIDELKAGKKTEPTGEPAAPPTGKKRGRPKKEKPSEPAEGEKPAEGKTGEKPKRKYTKRKKPKRTYYITDDERERKRKAFEKIRGMGKKKGSKKRKPLTNDERKARVEKVKHRRKYRKHRKARKASRPTVAGIVIKDPTMKIISKIHADLSRLELAIAKFREREKKVTKKEPDEKKLKMRLRHEIYKEMMKKLRA